MTPFLFVLVLCFVAHVDCTHTPVIGVMSLDYREGNQSFIAASYVKWIESGGGRVVPIGLERSKSYYKSLLSQLNGVLFPGIDLKPVSPAIKRSLATALFHEESAKLVFDIAQEFNKKGDYFPVWGTCNGFGFILSQEADVSGLFMGCDAYDFPATVNFTYNDLNSLRKESKLFFNLQEELYDTMRKDNVTVHYHRGCLIPEKFQKSELNSKYRVLAVNKDRNGFSGVSLVEAIDKPYYASIFHPEKVPFEFIEDDDHKNIPHDLKAIQTSQYFSNFFVNECRKSSHVFDMKSKLIYNFKPEYTIHYQNYEQMYFFNYTRVQPTNK